MNDPFARLPVVPDFTVTSTDVTDGQPLPPAQMSGIFQVPGGKDLSPQLSWSGAPAETKSYTVTMYDPDAPSGSGFWHWALVDIPASVIGLPAGTGDGTDEHLPTGAFHLPNDARLARFIGAGPPPGDGRHRYVIVVQALGIEKVGQLQLRVQADSTPAWLGFSINISGHLLGRAVITPTAEIPAA
jgi:Raf kinase inhibitor-like YbhB/YbcL family protein